MGGAFLVYGLFKLGKMLIDWIPRKEQLFAAVADASRAK